jgi:hypothetical protein
MSMTTSVSKPPLPEQEMAVRPWSLAPCHATAMCDLFLEDSVQLTPQGYAAQVMESMAKGDVSTSVGSGVYG